MAYWLRRAEAGGYGIIVAGAGGRATQARRDKVMKLSQVIECIDGQVLTEGVGLDREVQGGCAADLMSDVLAYSLSDAILLTGLCNPQVVRTAQMADVAAVVFVRGKVPSHDTLELANTENIPLISSPYGMFEMSGRLFAAGLPSCETSIS
jgi:predicted transcriptional regulator